MLVETASDQAVVACRRSLLGLEIKDSKSKTSMARQATGQRNSQKPQQFETRRSHNSLLDLDVKQRARAVGKLHPACLE
jgi:hypothetical protein